MIVLDTHAWLWWLTATERLSDVAREAIDQVPSVGVWTLSAWEPATLSARGRISLDRDIGLWLVERSPRHAWKRSRRVQRSPSRPAFWTRAPSPETPIDRLIYTTAHAMNAPLDHPRRSDPRV